MALGATRRQREAPPPLNLAALRAAQPMDAQELKPKGAFYGLLSLFRPGLKPHEAYYALLAAAAAVDGRVSAEESQEVTALAHRTRTLSKLNREALEAIRRAIAPRLERAKLAELIDHAAKSLPKKMRLSVFGHCCDLVFADRVVLLSEREYLKRLIALLNIPEETAEDMMRAIRAKNLH